MKNRKSAIKRSEKRSVITSIVDERLLFSLRIKDTILPPSALPAAEKIKRVYFSNKSLMWTRLVVPVDGAKRPKRAAFLYALARTASPSSIR